MARCKYPVPVSTVRNHRINDPSNTRLDFESTKHTVGFRNFKKKCLVHVSIRSSEKEPSKLSYNLTFHLKHFDYCRSVCKNFFQFLIFFFSPFEENVCVRYGDELRESSSKFEPVLWSVCYTAWTGGRPRPTTFVKRVVCPCRGNAVFAAMQRVRVTTRRRDARLACPVSEVIVPLPWSFLFLPEACSGDANESEINLLPRRSFISIIRSDARRRDATKACHLCPARSSIHNYRGIRWSEY